MQYGIMQRCHRKPLTNLNHFCVGSWLRANNSCRTGTPCRDDGYFYARNLRGITCQFGWECEEIRPAMARIIPHMFYCVISSQHYWAWRFCLPDDVFKLTLNRTGKHYV